MGFYEQVKTKAETGGQWAVIALGFSIPVSTAADNILIGLSVFLWVLSNSYRERFSNMRDNPVALWAVVVFAMYLLGVTYSVADGKDILSAVEKSAYLLLIPLFMVFSGKRRSGTSPWAASWRYRLSFLSFPIFSGSISCRR